MSEPKLLYEGKHICPVCHKETLVIKEYVYEAPKVGKLELSVWECENCGFRVRDVKPFETLTPIKLEYKIETENDLNTIVYRSAFASIIIPELGVEITAGSAYQGIITTVEGILEIIIDQINECNEKTCKDIFEAKEGKKPFTLIIEDPSGLSFIQSEKVVIKKLDNSIQP
ncbi:ZPR1 zinc finger domain-containing protein [Sulfurisphaera ohwakuensis]|uniref:ZPR1 zinc finger domain-containing protein n=1 Tax=Sulfurisphaera ohwakuensis TaxID=69656 RepID=UPI0036F1FB85